LNALTFVWLSVRRHHCSSHTRDFARRHRLLAQAATKNHHALRADFGVVLLEPTLPLDSSCATRNNFSFHIFIFRDEAGKKFKTFAF
jgi:hypothetical protein